MCGSKATNERRTAPGLSFGSLFGTALVMSSLAAGPAAAQSEAVLDEIIITAQKREQTLQEVPASVSAISGETVRDYLGSAENIRALANRVPSLNIESSNGRTQPRLYIRGQGNIDFDNNAAQPVGMVYDDIFLETNVLRSLPLFDIDRVEVLAGPQGSLFGRNTNAGLIKIDSVKPSFESNGYFSANYGDRDTLGAEFAAGGQVAESVAARIALKHQRRSNWINNINNGPGKDFGEFEETAYRLQFLVEPGEKFSGLFKIHGFQQDGTQPQVFYANALEVGKKGVRSEFNERQANHDGAAGMELDHYGFSANLKWEMDDYTITSITGVDSVENFQFTDVDGGVSTFDPDDIGALGISTFPTATGDGLDDHQQVTQELRVSSEGDKTYWQAGLYVLSDSIDVRTFDFGADSEDIISQDTDSVAVFGQVEYAISDAFSITAGARFTSDDKKLEVKPGENSGSPADIIEVDDDFFSFDLAFTYDVSDEWSWYGRLANASRGPVTIGRFGFTSAADTETTNSIEAGFKSELMGGRARWNTSVYYYVNDDQQITATGGAGNVNQLLNADKVNGNGFETSFEMLVTDNFLFNFNASFNDTEIDDPGLKDDLCGSAPGCTPLDDIVGTRDGPFGPVTEVSIDGNPLPRTPEWTYNVSLQYDWPVAGGSMYAHTDWNYRDDANLFLHESIEFVADSRVLGGIRLGYRTDTTDFAIVGRNITDEISVDGGINFNNLTVFINEPRYFGLEMRLDF